MKNVINHLTFLIVITVIFLSSCSKNVVTEPQGQATLDPSNPVMASSIGIGSGSSYFNFSDARDLATPFDYTSAGVAKHILCYRPGTGIVYVFANTAALGAPPVFQNMYSTSTGIGGSGDNYNLNDNRDRIIPYDLDGTGKLDHLICYRPGAGSFWIFKTAPGVPAKFQSVIKTNGVGGFNLLDSRDQIVPFDFYSTGKATQLLVYRPGTKTCWVLNNTAAVGATPSFSPVFQSSNGIGIPGLGTGSSNFDLSDSRDLIVPFDINGTGHKDGLICYRPGTGIVYTFKHDLTNGFYARYYSNTGIYNETTFPTGVRYDLTSNTDRIIAYDYYSSGQTNNIVCYRPGVGTCYMFSGFYGMGGVQYYTSSGIGTGSTYFDLHGTMDKVFAYDFDGTGKIDHLVAYRPGGGAFWIFSNSKQQIY